jgi:LysR family transcriptional regulator of gallate degradation
MIEAQSSPSDLLRQQLHNLRVFVAVAEARSIAHAARQLFKAPSAVTRSILELERALGISLFERTSRGMLANAYGEIVLTRACRIEDEIREVADELSRARARASLPSSKAIGAVLANGRKLELVATLVELRNISAVAPRMGMTQAGASMALSRIETALGQALFTRRAEGMVPTEAAERIAMRSRRILAELRHLESELSEISGASRGTVVIGTTNLGRSHGLQSALASALARRPGVRLSCIESAYEQLIRGLQNGDIDMVVTVLRPNGPGRGLTSEPLFADRMAVLARSGHPLAQRPRIEMAELVAETWILPRPHALGKQQVDACFLQLGLAPPSPSVETGDVAMLRQLLTASDMLAIAAPSQFRFEIEAGLLVELPVSLPGALVDVGLVLREGAMLPPAALDVVQSIREGVQSQDAGPTPPAVRPRRTPPSSSLRARRPRTARALTHVSPPGAAFADS